MTTKPNNIAALKKENLRLQKMLFKHEATITTLKNKVAIYEPIVREATAKKKKAMAFDDETDEALRKAVA